jgi:5-oxoprolinase (ATP-hydrolysing)
MWVASRGHHADIGGITPGSMPGNSTKLSEEGVIIAPTIIANFGELDKKRLKEILTKAPHPVRNYELNEHDIQAKLSANLKGAKEIQDLAKKYGADYLDIMSKEILSYSYKKIQIALKDIVPKKISKRISSERQITFELNKEKGKFVFDFKGTSPIQNNNFNAPIPVVKATLLFSLRCLINENIPLNNGIMQGVELLIPPESLLSPALDSAVVAGNVETSQALCDVIFEALDIKAHSQGTMNNLSFGNDHYQYYETLAGGSGASKYDHGASAIQVNMTNSLLTDPEVLEMRYPVRLELMSIRHGSGGLGRFNGGDGIYRRIKFLEPMQVSMLTQAREIPPQGINHGQVAQRGLNQIEESGKLIEMPESFQREFMANESIFISTPGGGGYGKPESKSKNLIFGFGSNMDLVQIKARCPSANLICRAKVMDKEIRYTRYSETRKGGVADMFEAVGHEVYGLVININDKDLKYLDKIECDYNGYKRIEIDAYDDNNQKFHCYAYDVIDKKPDIPPTKIYEWLVYSGAYYLNTPQAYLNNIKNYRED